MFYQSNYALQQQLTHVKTSVLGIGGTGVTIKLAKTGFAPNPDSDPTTFPEADYTGYAAVTATTMTGISQTGNSFESSADTVASFAPTGSTVGNQIAGYWFEDSAGHLLGYEQISPAIPMTGPLDSIDLVFRWQAQPASWPNTILP